MDVKLTAINYSQKIKNVIVQMAIDDTLPMDLTELNTEEITKILEPVFQVIWHMKKDAEMAMDGSWDCTTDEGIETGFGAQLDIIDELDLVDAN